MCIQEKEHWYGPPRGEAALLGAFQCVVRDGLFKTGPDHPCGRTEAVLTGGTDLSAARWKSLHRSVVYQLLLKRFYKGLREGLRDCSEPRRRQREGGGRRTDSRWCWTVRRPHCCRQPCFILTLCSHRAVTQLGVCLLCSVHRGMDEGGLTLGSLGLLEK